MRYSFLAESLFFDELFPIFFVDDGLKLVSFFPFTVGFDIKDFHSGSAYDQK